MIHESKNSMVSPEAGSKDIADLALYVYHHVLIPSGNAIY